MFDFLTIYQRQMIDFVKVRINDNGFLRQNQNFDFVGKVNPETGEQKDGKLTAEIKNLGVMIVRSHVREWEAKFIV